MMRVGDTLVTVEAELQSPLATTQLLRFDMAQPSDNLYCQKDGYWLDLCLTPRPLNTRACYPGRWSPHRFHRMGDIFLVPPGETMHAKGDCAGRQDSIVCFLHPEPVRRWFDADLDWTDRRLEESLDIASPNVRGLLLRLADEMRQPGFASEMMAELIAAQIAIELSRYCVAITDRPATGGLAPWRLRLIDERLKESGATPTLTELAGLCNLSVRQLTRGFRASRNCSIGDYVARSRIDNAKRLLATKESVKSIAYTMGFASPSAFCYAFRRATGQTPREFQQKIPRGN